MEKYKSLTETLLGDRRFSMFAKMMESSNTFGQLEHDGEFTIFAPSNHALIKVPPTMMNTWLNEPGQRCLRALLSYHIIPGRILGGEIASESTRMSIAGEDLRFSDEKGLRVNESIVTSRNILASNGVIHAINTILVRPSEFLTLSAIFPLPMEVPHVLPSTLPDAEPFKASLDSTRRSRMRATQVL